MWQILGFMYPCLASNKCFDFFSRKTIKPKKIIIIRNVWFIIIVCFQLLPFGHLENLWYPHNTIQVQLQKFPLLLPSLLFISNTNRNKPPALLNISKKSHRPEKRPLQIDFCFVFLFLLLHILSYLRFLSPCTYFINVL